MMTTRFTRRRFLQFTGGPALAGGVCAAMGSRYGGDGERR